MSKKNDQISLSYTTITRKIELKPVYNTKDNFSEEQIKQEKKKVWDKIREVDLWTARIANRVATECWSTWQPYIGKPKREFPQIDPYKIFSQKLCVEYPELKQLKISSVASGISKDIKEKVYGDFYDIAYGKKSLPSYKSGLPMYVPREKSKDNKGYGSIGQLLKKDNDQYEFSTVLGKMKLFFGRDRSDNKSIIDKCKLGEYDLCDSKIQYNKGKNKIFLLATIKIPIKKENLDYDKYIGVDLGIKVPIVASVYYEESKKVFIGSIDDFLKERMKYFTQKRKLQKQLKNSRGSHGRSKKLSILNRFDKKEKNWVRTKNHTYSKKLIDFCLKNNCGNIVLEDLSGFNDSDKNQKFIGRYWSYFELQSMIENKAKKYGINVIKVNPKNTSKACSKCGNVHIDNRKSQSEFECINCGNKMNADLNASQNIVAKHLNVFDFSEKVFIFTNELS